MTLDRLLTAIAIHLLVPLAGLTVFCWLCFRMSRAGIPEPPFIAYFILFATLGGWVLIALTALFWEWSGMATLGLFYLVLAAPFVTAVLAWRLRSRRGLSAFHKGAFLASAVYSSFIVALDIVWLGILLTRHIVR